MKGKAMNDFNMPPGVSAASIPGNEPTREEVLARMTEHGVIAPEGVCSTCDLRRKSTDPLNYMETPHAANQKCESGCYPHCSCDTCF